MNKVLYTSCIIIATLLNGCAEKEPEKDSSLAPSSAVLADTNTRNTVQTLPPGVMDSATAATMTVPSQNITQGATTTAAAPGMNPAHGQPGHRCDIAVGAPLNSAPAKPAVQSTQTITPTPPATTSATPAITQPPAAPVKTAPGMNPPHGQPNHRCDIAVGAPLNSPATKPATQTITPVNVPAPPNAQPADSGKKGK